MYSDDMCAKVVSVHRMVRFLRIYYFTVGGGGLPALVGSGGS